MVHNNSTSGLPVVNQSRKGLETKNADPDSGGIRGVKGKNYFFFSFFSRIRITMSSYCKKNIFMRYHGF